MATRVLIATQEPTLAPALIDLCNVTIVHRFLSPAWFETLKKHLAGARPAGGNDSSSVADIFHTIVGLQTGDALLFSPTALLDIGVSDLTKPFARPPLQKLTDSYIKLRIRKRITADGGRSIMASDATRAPMLRSELRSESEGSSTVSSETSDSELEVIALPSSRFGRPAAPTRQRQPQPTPQTLQPALQLQPQKLQPARSQPLRALSQPQKTPLRPQQALRQVCKEKKALAPAALAAQPQPQSQQAPAQQLTKRQKKALNQATISAQPQPQQGPPQLTKKQKKALQQAPLAPSHNSAASQQQSK